MYFNVKSNVVERFCHHRTRPHLGSDSLVFKDEKISEKRFMNIASALRCYLKKIKAIAAMGAPISATGPVFCFSTWMITGVPITHASKAKRTAHEL